MPTPSANVWHPMGVTPFFWDTHHLVPDIAHAPAVPQKMGASKKTGCDTHWVPDIGTQWRACTCFLVLKCVYPKKNSVTPIGCQTLAPSGAHAPVCPQEKGASKKTGWDTHWVPDIGFKMCLSQKN